MSGEKFAAIKKNLEILECPLLGNGEDWWMKDLLIAPGQYKLQLLEWLLTKLDGNLKKTVFAGIAADTMPVATKKMNTVLSALGLNRKDDCNLLSNTCSVQQQIQFWTHLTEVVVAHQKYQNDCSSLMEDNIPMQGSKEHCSMQFENSCLLLDSIAQQGKLPELFNTEINLFPPDIMKGISRHQSENSSKIVPDLPDLKKQLENIEDILSKETEILQHLQNGHSETMGKCENTQEQLNLALVDFIKLCKTYSETYNDLKPWFSRSEPELVEFGPKLELICSQLSTWSTFKDNLATIIQCCSKLKELENCLREKSVNKTSLSSKIKELNLILQSIIEFNKEYSAISNSITT